MFYSLHQECLVLADLLNKGVPEHLKKLKMFLKGNYTTGACSCQGLGKLGNMLPLDKSGWAQLLFHR